MPYVYIGGVGPVTHMTNGGNTGWINRMHAFHTCTDIRGILEGDSTLGCNDWSVGVSLTEGIHTSTLTPPFPNP